MSAAKWIYLFSISLSFLCGGSSTLPIGKRHFELLVQRPMEEVAADLYKLAEFLHRGDVEDILEESLRTKRDVGAIMGVLSSLGTVKSIISGLPKLIRTAKQCADESSRRKRSIFDDIGNFFKKAASKVSDWFVNAWSDTKSFFGYGRGNKGGGNRRSTFRERMDDFLSTTRKGLKKAFNFGSCMMKKNADNELLLNAIQVFGKRVIKP
ncbi:Uncharacterised protein g3059 [Pycnogonum litorale]